MLSENESVLYCVSTKNKSKPECTLDKKKYKPLRQKKKFHKVNGRIFYILHPTVKDLLLFQL